MTCISISETSEQCREACDLSETKTKTNTKKYNDKDKDKDKDKDNLVTQLTIPDLLRNSMLDSEGK